MTITDEKIKIYKLLADIIIKFVLSISILVAFFIILFNVLKPSNPAITKLTLGFIDLILAGTLYKVYTHYFPKKTK